MVFVWHCFYLAKKIETVGKLFRETVRNSEELAE